MTSVVEVENLRKNYNEKVAINGMSFEVKKGEILGLLGPNGAGKSTMINILATVLSPTSGNVKMFGRDLKKGAKHVKQGIGIVPQDLAIFEEISAEKNVRFFAGLYNLKGNVLDKRVEEALKLVRLYERKDDKPKTFSGGMKRRLNIACGIAHRPELVIMDEPSVGIDPQSRNHILESIKTLKNNGATIIYSTHYMEEAEAISDRIMIMNEGQIIAQGTKEDLHQKVKNQTAYAFQLTQSERVNVGLIYQIEGVKSVQMTEDTFEITVDQSNDHVGDIIAALTKEGCQIINMASKKASLETVFLELTGRSLRD
ncbi:ABC transporter ATP-binding protein [Bacillus sonorensis]|uniref:ABC-type MDR transporter, ATPase n=2 Tax=Bacillus sonorensis TaxID=119858 RepID=M5NZP8_9BACI|nr:MULTISPECIES: ABC transporter ATP-binding protein [Bacillus]TWK74015.1 Daunorubicin/doxorubicin resistance ATP-binding protein DrrA [Bacillus paralicheniformis]ASB91315.1 Phosphonates import ATP-binding protein PhnC [Bacillus sonorensis]EME72648.1 ABC-type MDR transporter, ATPase [Bacillus sonorensis L12]MBG9917348.1 antibiotic ABC transporter ATP-binding protein [Bacillus sonorensis]MCY7857202.1 ABC transporter ATP-binding protein [Bacillus sonorensis]